MDADGLAATTAAATAVASWWRRAAISRTGDVGILNVSSDEPPPCAGAAATLPSHPAWL